MIDPRTPKRQDDEGHPRLLVTVTGPSCAGKTEMVQWLIQQFPNEFGYIRSLATRQPRNEAEHQIYRFITREEFEAFDNQLLVLQKVFFKNNYYGSHRQDILTENAGKIAIAIVEPSGVDSYLAIAKHFNLPYVSVFLDGDKATITDRWVDRLCEAAKRNALIDTPLDKHYFARRIEAIDEELNWRTFHDYSLRFPPYHEGNRESLAVQVGDRLIEAATGNLPTYKYAYFPVHGEPIKVLTKTELDAQLQGEG